MDTKTKVKQIDIFWDNGKYVAVIVDENGTRCNVARYNCQTKIDAEIDARNCLGIPLTRKQQNRESGYC